jgi:hypothetical protein
MHTPVRMHFGIQGGALVRFESAEAVVFAQLLSQVATHRSPDPDRANPITEKVIKVFALLMLWMIENVRKIN